MTFLLPKRTKRAKMSVGRDGKIRCPSHLKWVRGHMCSVPHCEQGPIEAAHVRLGSHAGMQQKPDDTKAISLCATHHAESHGGEATFAAKYKLDLHAIAAVFEKASPHRHRWVKQ